MRIMNLQRSLAVPEGVSGSMHTNKAACEAIKHLFRFHGRKSLCLPDEAIGKGH